MAVEIGTGGTTEPSPDREEITRRTSFGTGDRNDTTRTSEEPREPAPSVASEIDIGRGTVIGRYTILDCIGAGGMAAVYSAHDAQLDRIVALKLLRPHDDVADVRARLFREAQAMARLSHPNVVTVYDVGVASDGRVFLSMEIASGGTLSAWLKQPKRTWREILDVVCDAGQGLAAAHDVGIVHRDFKPENILIGADGRPRVTDFGVASEVIADPGRVTSDRESGAPGAPSSAQGASSNGSDGTISNRTKTDRATLGTPGYMAPEQYLWAEEVDARADVFAFCATLYRALYGQRPFEGSSVAEIAGATFSGQVRAVPKGSDVPLWLRGILVRGLAPDRSMRPASMRVLLAELRADPIRRRRRWMAGAATFMACIAVAWGVRASSQRKVEACRAMGDRWGGIWDGARKQAIEDAFRATNLTYASDTWMRVERALDGYTQDWAGAMERACIASRVHGERSDAMLQLQAACMDTKLDEVRALSDVLAGADAKTVESAVRATQSLSGIDACTDLDRVSAAARLPSDASARWEIRALQSEIAAAKALQYAGKPRQSLDRLHAIDERVARTAFGPLLVGWRMRMASNEAQLDAASASANFERAVTLADTYRLDIEKTEALLGLVRNETRSGHYDQSHRWLEFAGAAIARAGGDVRLKTLRDVAEGWLLVQEGKTAQAIPLLEQAIAATRQKHFDDADIYYAYSALATALVAERRFDEGFKTYRTAIDLAETELGPLNPWITTFFYNNLASDQLDAGRIDDALATASHGVELLEAAARRGELVAGARSFSIARSTLGQALLRAGKLAEAIERLSQAHEAFREANDVLAVVTCNELAEAHRRAGRFAEAKRWIEQAKAIAASQDRVEPSFRAAISTVDAKIAADQGRADKAPLTGRASVDRTSHIRRPQ